MDIKLDEKEIKQLALGYMNYSGENVYDAVIKGLVTWLNKKDLMIIPKLPKGREQKELDTTQGG